jgi:hypothetical protein
MFYNRVWFAKKRLAWTMGGGLMTNPGRGGVTSQTGYSSSILDPNWRPDLIKSENRIIIALLVRS